MLDYEGVEINKDIEMRDCVDGGEDEVSGSDGCDYTASSSNSEQASSGEDVLSPVLFFTSDSILIPPIFQFLILIIFCFLISFPILLSFLIPLFCICMILSHYSI